VEAGDIVLIGATTENPSFEVNAPLLSRATVHVLKALDEQDMRELLARGREALGAPPVSEAATLRLIGYADGDARRLLNTLETLAVVARRERVDPVDEPWMMKVLGERMRRFDKGGEQFYDMLSAFHKWVRGCDPDAALYWLVRMVDGGMDPMVIFRRSLAMAAEDIGLADPEALKLIQSQNSSTLVQREAATFSLSSLSYRCCS